eukprot:SAG25_NODE_1043_length_4188_cov_5.770604_2_plen_91_part_00
MKNVIHNHWFDLKESKRWAFKLAAVFDNEEDRLCMLVLCLLQADFFALEALEEKPGSGVSAGKPHITTDLLLLLTYHCCQPTTANAVAGR